VCGDARREAPACARDIGAVTPDVILLIDDDNR
jgi:hypothetical protein